MRHKNDRRVEVESEERRGLHYISWEEGADKGHYTIWSIPDLSSFSF